jgi:hypothetical protein
MRPALGRHGWVLLMTANPPRAIWQKFTGNSSRSETWCAQSFYSNFFQPENHLPFKNLGLK